MSIFERCRYEVPGLNTASLPDLIFTVLFFFMIVTHMRKVTLKVQYRAPHATELTRLTKKTAVSYVYIGRPERQLQAVAGSSTRIQLNDKFATANQIVDYIEAERNRMSPEDKQQMTVSIKADKSTKMAVITDVKQALRRANALKISYSATKEQ